VSSPDPYRYFRIEARELLEQLGKGVLALEKEGGVEQIVFLLRLAHTLKGAARVVKQAPIADGAHRLEELLGPYRSGEQTVPRTVLDELLVLVDQMAAQLAEIGRPAPSVTPKPQAPPAVTAPSPVPEVRTVRAELEEMDRLLDGLAEAHVQLAGLKRTLGTLAEAGELADLLAEQVAPLRTGASPAAIKARSLAEELRATLGRLERTLGFESTQIDRELRSAREAAERLRLVPARVLSTPLERAVRDAAHAEDKDVVYSIRGDDVRLDAHVIEGVQAALIQLARNAVAHGIEPASRRRAAGKPLAGRVAFAVERRGRRIAFVCQDDGQGIDVAAIQKSAEARGLPRPADAAAAIEVLLGGGISTAGKVTEIAGRGIGLGLARAAARQLGGELSFKSEPGVGASVELVVPVPLAAIPALVVEADGMAASVPLESVRRGVRLAASDLSCGPTGETVVHDGKVIPFVALSRAVSGTSPARDRAWSAIVVECASGTAALGVDRLVGTTQVVVRPLPELAPAGAIVGGASFDPEGNPQLVLDPDGIVAAAHGVWSEPAQAPARRRILVVDDSLTTRMLEQSILESAGYEVELASSGEEGLEKARAGGHALFLVDVEMPGIDGFTFVERINADPELRRTPAILVTSLSAPENLRRGREVGAKDYVVKGDFDQGRLLARIRELIS
jgi:two-component system, chemotaxis family, sensor kinase CheA